MRSHFIAVSLSLVLLMGSALSAESQERTPVLVELFTSEGCSSCPPADALLQELQHSQPITGALIVPIGLHVDYWNYIGWTDRFSSPQFSRRQESYSSRFRQGPFTPQIVIDGVNQIVGSDRRAALSAIADASREPKPVRVKLLQDKTKLRVLVEGPRTEASDVLLAVTENNVETRVLRGENGGKVLRHTAVARDLKLIGNFSQQKWEREIQLLIPPGANAANLQAIVFVQSQHTGQVLGMAVISLTKL